MWDIRTVTPEEVALFRSRLSRGFGQDAETDDEAVERFAAVFEPDRMFGVFDAGDMVGTGGAFSLGLSVPGQTTVPMGGTTMVTVQATHRRRGILRELMARHLDEVAGRGEPVAGLWASEAAIYGRFGYGPAAFRHHTEVDAAKAGITTPTAVGPQGSLRLIDREEAGEALPEVYERARVERSGMLTRSEDWWNSRILADSQSRRQGRSGQRYLVHEVEGVLTGYAIYRQKPEWGDFVADGEIEVIELIATQPVSHRAIWTFLTSIDLFPRVGWWNAPIDDPLARIVRDSRRVRRTLSDSLWVRILDVPAALSARGYDGDSGIVLGVHDATRDECAGTYELEVVGGRGTCRRADAEPDVDLDVNVLGHLYLGGGNAMMMASAGRIEGDQASIMKLHRIFRSDLAPWCPEIF